jgi:hypothetical protein
MLRSEQKIFLPVSLAHSMEQLAGDQKRSTPHMLHATIMDDA